QEPTPIPEVQNVPTPQVKPAAQPGYIRGLTWQKRARNAAIALAVLLGILAVGAGANQLRKSRKSRSTEEQELADLIIQMGVDTRELETAEAALESMGEDVSERADFQASVDNYRAILEESETLRQTLAAVIVLDADPNLRSDTLLQEQRQGLME